MLLTGPNALVVFGSRSASTTRTRDRRLAVLAASACASVRDYGPLVQADLTPAAGSPRMDRPQAILFDVDGLLITTGGAGTRSWRWAFNELYGIPADIGKFTDAG